MPKRPILLSILFSIIPLLGWWTYGLLDLDEGFYAAITGEMNRRGEWITPLYNGHPWFEKPILLYWFAKPSVAAFGEMIGPRLPSVLATIGLYAVCAWFAKRRLGTTQAVLVPLILGSSLLLVGIGRMMLTDPLLVLSLISAYLTFWESLVGDKRWRLVTAFALGIGVLAKGPVACLLFVPVAGWTYWRNRDLRPAFKGWWLVGTLILALTVASWYVPAYLANGQLFVQKFLIEQNVGRFTGGDTAHTVGGLASILMYVPIVFIGVLPGLILVWTSGSREKRNLSIQQPDESNKQVRTYLWTCAWVVFLFFSISGAKLPHYIAPVIPSLALLICDSLASRIQKLTLPALIGPAISVLVVACIAQWAFSSYYYGTKLGSLIIPGFHSEVHELTRYVRSHASPIDVVAEYQMSRREKELGTGKPKLQETSHPSTLFYLDRDIVDTDNWDEILIHPGKVWIITRWNRINQAEKDKVKGRELVLEKDEDLYKLWSLTPKSVQ